MTAPAADVLDPLMDEEDQTLLASLSQPPALDANPVPDLPETEIAATPAPEIDAISGPTPDSIDAIIAEDAARRAPSQGGTVVPPAQGVNPTIPLPSEEATIRKQADLDARKAEIEARRADREAAIAQERDEDTRLAHATYVERRAAAENDLAKRVAQFESAKLVDPREKGSSAKATLAVIFGGLGAGMSAAGGGSGENLGLKTLQKRWDDDLATQKANIGLLKDATVMARTRLDDVETGRRALEQSANAQALARYNSAIKQGEAQLRRLGVDQAGIAGDQRLVALKTRRDQIAAEAQKNADAHAIALARIKYMDARAARAARGKTGGAAGRPNDAEAQLSQHLIENPGDIPGVRRLGAQLKVDPKRVDKAIENSKGTEGQTKDAQQASVGLRAIGAIEKAGFTPKREEIQKWINNQRLVQGAQSDSIKGLALTAGQNLPGPLRVPQSETEGLSEPAQEYFAQVRRYIETIGRKQSGAAISPTEWQNFFNQYGPNSKGGLAAAREYLQDQMRTSGVAGRTISGGGEAPKVDRLALAKQAMNDPDATPEERAQAAKIVKRATGGK